MGAVALYDPLSSFASNRKLKRIGIIGLDTSHAIAFTKILYEGRDQEAFGGYLVTAAYPLGSPKIAQNAERISRNTTEIQQYGVHIVNSIADLLAQVDYVLLETNDGNNRLEQATEVLKQRKPMFIDKPIANSFQDASAIFKLAEEYKTPVFSCSALRFIAGLEDIDREQVVGADVYSPAPTEPHHKDLYWYGIHGVEMLFAIMGERCLDVQTVAGDQGDVYVGRWDKGRVGILRTMKEHDPGFGGVVFTNEKTITLGTYTGYIPLIRHIVDFFDTGTAPVSTRETLRMCKFIDAAYESKLKNGAVVAVCPEG